MSSKELHIILVFISCILLSVTANMFSQNGSIGGTISFGYNRPVAKAEILLKPASYNTVTNDSGFYVITNIKPGKYTLIVTRVGFKKLKKQIAFNGEAQVISFSLDSSTVELPEIVINAQNENDFGIGRLKSVEGTAIYAGKKNEVIILDDIAANTATNNSRQIYSKVPGINIWESDGGGLQLGIGGRGLNPSRVSNFNTRQNGYDMSADAMGYPESYYTPPTEALERIEVVRGAASLQYGTQFGGMINFRLKPAPAEKPLNLLIRQSFGSFGLYNSFTSFGGTCKKISYNTFYQYKKSDGWRKNSNFDSHAAYASIGYAANDKLKITLDLTHTNYLAKQPGGLTDKMFLQDPQQSVRDRNWFGINWNMAALNLNYEINSRNKFNFIGFGLLASKDGLGYLGSVNRADPLGERDLQKDNYKNAGTELRYMNKYTLLNNTSVLLVGARYYQGQTTRRQSEASKASDADFTFIYPASQDESSYKFPSRNIAFFTENVFNISSSVSITPGIRYENIYTSANGFYNTENKDLAGNVICSEKIDEKRENTRSFVLGGIGISYKQEKGTELYGNISQNYRAINFNDMRIINPSLRVNPNLKDENGFSADIGYRGHISSIINFDISVFIISYNNRIGSVLRVDSNTYNIYRYRTNISDSRNIGLESFIEVDVLRAIKKDSKTGLSVFTNFSRIDARYINSSEAAFNNKLVELVPNFIVRTGIELRNKKIKASLQYAFTSKQYTDATNAESTVTAVNGIVLEYSVVDFTAEYSFNNKWSISGSINNLFDAVYFSRRADGYPGPGILPSDPRSYYLTLLFKL